MAKEERKTTWDMAMEGAEAAAAHADREIFEWRDRALSMIQKYANTHVIFLTEEVRVWSYEQGLPVPPDPRAWGSVVREAKRLEIIEQCGFAMVKVPPAHSRHMAQWKSLIYQGPTQ